MRKLARTLSIFGLAALVGVALACDDDGTPIDPGNGNGNGNGGGSNVVSLSGDIISNRTLSPDSIYVVVGFLEVQPGATLTIPAGTDILSDRNTRGTIVTLRAEGDQPSGRLVVQGTPVAPVVFRPGTVAEAEAGLVPAQALACDRGQAGGIVMHGNAPVNQPGTVVSEGVARPFGGDDPADDSGDLQYLVILCGGVRVTPDNEINGLTMAGVGTGTTISHVQAHAIADDGFEWFGGTVHGDHLVSSANDDDAFDCDFGWNGTVQFGVAVQDRNLANRGMECDNDGNGSDFMPITAPNLWNFTWVGAGVAQANSEVNDGLYLRRNAAPVIRNAIVSNFGNIGAVIDGSASKNQALEGALDLDFMLFFNNQRLQVADGGTGDPVTDNIAFRLSSMYQTADVLATFGGNTLTFADPQFGSVNLANPINGTAPDLRPAANSPALDAANATTPTGPGIVDANATYVGAFDANNDWMGSWTVWLIPG